MASTKCRACNHPALGRERGNRRAPIHSCRILRKHLAAYPGLTAVRLWRKPCDLCYAWLYGRSYTNGPQFGGRCFRVPRENSLKRIQKFPVLLRMDLAVSYWIRALI